MLAFANVNTFRAEAVVTSWSGRGAVGGTVTIVPPATLTEPGSIIVVLAVLEGIVHLVQVHYKKLQQYLLQLQKLH